MKYVRYMSNNFFITNSAGIIASPAIMQSFVFIFLANLWYAYPIIIPTIAFAIKYDSIQGR